MVNAVREAALSVARPEKLPFVYLWVFFASFFLLLLLATAGEVISTSPPPSTGSRAALSASSRSSFGRHLVALFIDAASFRNRMQHGTRTRGYVRNVNSLPILRPAQHQIKGDLVPQSWTASQIEGRQNYACPAGLLLAASNPHACFFFFFFFFFFYQGV